MDILDPVRCSQSEIIEENANKLPSPIHPEPEKVRRMFDEIAVGYDRFNGLASLGMDKIWRKVLVDSLIKGGSVDRVILDLGTGTGDLINDFLYKARLRTPRPGPHLIGLDISREMIRLARIKVASGAYFVQGSGDKIPLRDGSVDVLMSAFTLRNVKNIMSAALKEVYRVLKPGGRVLFMEMFVPNNRGLKILHQVYLRLVLPLVGRVVFGRRWSGDYLSRTILNFGTPGQFSNVLREIGFCDVRHQLLTGGISVLHSARKSG